jgi:hypothetical protein
MVMPTHNIAAFVIELAKLHNVTYTKTSIDELADVITNLADDDVKMDRIELLLIALERAGVIASDNIVPLHINYLREKLNLVGNSGISYE